MHDTSPLVIATAALAAALSLIAVIVSVAYCPLGKRTVTAYETWTAMGVAPFG
jgi:hypothetical protein